MIKAICMDLDGTLLSDDKIITPNTVQCLREVAQAGIKLIMASGRVRTRMEKYAEQVELIKHGGVIIEANGASIYDYTLDKEQVIRRMYKEEAQELVSFLKARDIEVLIMGEVDIYIILASNESESRYLRDHANMEGLQDRQFYYIQSLDEIQDSINKITVYEDPDVITTLQHDLANTDFKYEYWYGCSAINWLEITVASVSKGNALEVVMKQYGYNKDEVVVFGDGENDLSMLKVVKYGVAMDNAMDSVKAQVNYHTTSNMEDGIVAFLKTIQVVK